MLNKAQFLDSQGNVAKPKPINQQPVNSSTIITIGVALILGYGVYYAFGEKLGLKAPKCTNRVKCKGMNSKGQLKKGYKFASKRKKEKHAKVVKV